MPLRPNRSNGTTGNCDTSAPSTGTSQNASSGSGAKISNHKSRKKHTIEHILKCKNGQAYLVSTPFLGPKSAPHEWTTEKFEMMESESQEFLDEAGFGRIQSVLPSNETEEFNTIGFNIIRGAFERTCVNFTMRQTSFRNFKHAVFVDNQTNRQFYRDMFENFDTDEFGKIVNPGKFPEQFVQGFETLTNHELKKKASTPNNSVDIMDMDMNVPASPTLSDTSAGTDSPNRDHSPYVFKQGRTDEHGNILNPGEVPDRSFQGFETLTNLELKKKGNTSNDNFDIMDVDVDVPASPTVSDTLAGSVSSDTLSEVSEGGWDMVRDFA